MCESESVRFPKGLTNIGRDAFAGCAKLANADGCVIVNDIPLRVAPQPSCLAETQAATKEKIHPGKDLYTDILHGFWEMADDAWAEDAVRALVDKYLADPTSIDDAENIAKLSVIAFLVIMIAVPPLIYRVTKSADTK